MPKTALFFVYLLALLTLACGGYGIYLFIAVLIGWIIPSFSTLMTVAILTITMGISSFLALAIVGGFTSH